MARVALVEKYPTNYNYKNGFPFEFDKFALVPEKMEKVLKKDITLDIQHVKDNYDYVIVVGKEAAKVVGGISSVTEFQGFLVDSKYLALMNPYAVNIRPSLKDSYNKAVSNILSYIEGDELTDLSKYSWTGIESEFECLKLFRGIITDIALGNITEMALDTETSSLYPREGNLLGISLATELYVGYYIDADIISDECVELLQQIINAVTVHFFNAKFDIKWLAYHMNLKFPKWEDIMLVHYSLDETVGSHGLKDNLLKNTTLGDYDRELSEFKAQYCRMYGIKVGDFTYDLIPFNIMKKYAALDAAGTFELKQKFFPVLAENKKLLYVYNRLLKEGTRTLIHIEENGIPLDREYLIQSIEDVNREVLDLTEQLYSWPEVKETEKLVKDEFNVNSPKHLSTLLFDVIGFTPIKFTDGGANSTDKDVLDELGDKHPVAGILLKIKQLKKINSTFLVKMLNGMDRDNRLRTSFNLHTTTSGRLSSSGKLNAQQFPRNNKMPKRAIRARKGFKIVNLDLKTAEMYVAGVLSGDKNLLNIFINGEDYHGMMAKYKFDLPCSSNEVATLYPDLRQEAKTVSFEILYKLNYNEPVLEKFPKLKKWLKDQEQFIKANGFIYSHLGRKRRLSDVFSPNRQEAQHMVRSGINFLVQSVSSDINLLAAIDMVEWIIANGYEKKMKIFALVHDSIVAEVDESVLELYSTKLKSFVQIPRAGLTIPGHPIGCDVEVGDTYAFDKQAA